MTLLLCLFSCSSRVSNRYQWNSSKSWKWTDSGGERRHWKRKCNCTLTTATHRHARYKHIFTTICFPIFCVQYNHALKKKQLSWTQICENPRLFLCLDHAELASRINRARVLGGSDIFPDSSRSFTGSLFRGSPSSQPSLSTSQQPSIQVQQPQQQQQQQPQQQHPFLR